MLQSMSGMEILFNMLVNRLHKTIVGIPYQISSVKNNFIVIKLQIRRFYLQEEWLAVVVILSGGTMSMVLLGTGNDSKQSGSSLSPVLLPFFMLRFKGITSLNNSHGNQRVISTTCLFLLILSYWTLINLISFHFIFCSILHPVIPKGRTPLMVWILFLLLKSNNRQDPQLLRVYQMIHFLIL